MLFLIYVSPDGHAPGCRICGHAETQVPSKSFCPIPWHIVVICMIEVLWPLGPGLRGQGRKEMPIWCLKFNMSKILPPHTFYRQELFIWPCYCKGSWEILCSMEEGRNRFAGERGICCILQAVLQLVCKIVEVRAPLAVLNMMPFV